MMRDMEEEFCGLACPPWDEGYANCVDNFNNDHHISLNPTSFFTDDDYDVPQVTKNSSSSLSSVMGVKVKQYGRGKEMRKVLAALKPTPKQVAAYFRLRSTIIINKKGVIKKVDQNKVVLPLGRKTEASSCSMGAEEFEVKLNNAKRKLHDAYQRLDAAKKQKSLKVIEAQAPPVPIRKPQRGKTHPQQSKFLAPQSVAFFHR